MLKTNTSTFWNSHQQPPRGIKNNHPSASSYAPPALHEADNHRIKLNADQRRTRCETALHEGTHLGVAIALGGYCHKAFIRVPEKTPANFYGHRGTLGGMQANHDDPFKEGCILLSGVVVEAIGQDLEKAYPKVCGDLRGFKDHAASILRTNQHVRLAFDEVLAHAYNTVVKNWAGIDAVAAGLLHLGHADGVVPRKNIYRIVDHYRSRAWVGRDTWRPAPSRNRVDMLLDVIRQRDPAYLQA